MSSEPERLNPVNSKWFNILYFLNDCVETDGIFFWGGGGNMTLCTCYSFSVKLLLAGEKTGDFVFIRGNTWQCTQLPQRSCHKLYRARVSTEALLTNYLVLFVRILRCDTTAILTSCQNNNKGGLWPNITYFPQWVLWTELRCLQFYVGTFSDDSSFNQLFFLFHQP